MANNVSSISDIEAVLAILGRVDRSALAALLDEGSPVPEASLAGLRSSNGFWTIEPPQAATLLADLERDDLARYRRLHERAIAYLADRLRNGETEVEAAFIAALERLGNRLLSDNPEQFCQLIDSVRDVPLFDTRNQQLLRYFGGLSLGLRDLYADALRIFDRLLAEPDLDDYVRGRCLNSRSVFCRITGRLQEAVDGYRQSITLWRRLGDRLNEGKALMNLAFVAYTLQQYDEIEEHLTEAARCFEEAGALHWLAGVRNHSGLSYMHQGRWDEAQACFEAVAEQSRADGSDDLLGAALNNIGEVLLLQGRLAEATPVFQEALALMTTSRTYAVNAHMNLGLVCQGLNDLPQARSAFRAALELAQAIDRREIMAEVHYRLGECLRQTGEAEAALAQFEAAAAVIEATRDPLGEEKLKISLLGRWQQVYEALVLHCLALNRPAEAFHWAERARARAFTETLLSGRLASEADRPSNGLGALSIATVMEVQAALPAGSRLLCYFTTGVLDRDVPLLKAIPKDNPLRDHLLTPPKVIVFAVDDDGLQAHECPLDPNLLISTSPRGQGYSLFLDHGVRRHLRRALLDLTGQTSTPNRRYLVPHGPLHLVPFEALVEQRDDTSHAPDDWQMTYAPSVTMLVRHAPASTRNGSGCLAIGYNSRATEQGLRYTEPEAELVAHLLGGEALSGSQPKQEQLRQLAEGRRWLHFACHGSFNHRRPLESYLEIAPDERLTALEVMQHWRLTADLVVLSACQTGVSRILRGDEPMGLIRAFLTAGAKAVVVSRWAVEDLPTFLLMGCFYRLLSDGTAAHPSAALQLARQWLRQATVADLRALAAMLPAEGLRADLEAQLTTMPDETRPFREPRYWAAFMLIGGI